jgi:hypothetical protein
MHIPTDYGLFHRQDFAFVPSGAGRHHTRLGGCRQDGCGQDRNGQYGFSHASVNFGLLQGTEFSSHYQGLFRKSG